MDIGNYKLDIIEKCGNLFLNNWLRKEKKNPLLKQLRSDSLYYPINIIYPEAYSNSVLRNSEKKSKKRKIVPESDTIITFMCDSCKHSDESETALFDHVSEAAHSSFSQYERRSDGITALLKPFYYTDLEITDNNKSLYICPYCDMLFINKFLCGYHVKISHNNAGSYYSTCSILSVNTIEMLRLQCCKKRFKTHLELFNHWSQLNFRCCPIFAQNKVSFKGLFIIICKTCFSCCSYRYSEIIPSNIIDFLQSHECFKRPKGTLNYVLHCMKVVVRDWNAMQVLKIHEFKDDNCREAVLFHYLLCVDICLNIQRYHNFQHSLMLDALKMSDYLITLLNATL